MEAYIAVLRLSRLARVSRISAEPVEGDSRDVSSEGCGWTGLECLENWG